MLQLQFIFTDYKDTDTTLLIKKYKHVIYTISNSLPKFNSIQLIRMIFM